MNEKRLLMTVLALFILTVLNMNIAGVSATPASPYIAVVPLNQRAQMTGLTFKVSINTDYSGNDVYLWHVQLAFNASVLQCTEVVNGDLITEEKDPNAMFSYVIENNVGEVSAGAYFYYQDPDIPPTTNGPGTLVNITFTGMNRGNSSLTLGKDTKLQGYNSVTGQMYLITEADLHPNRIGHGSIMITIQGDCDFDKDVDGVDFGIFAPCYGSSVGQPAYNAVADIDASGKVDGVDFGMFAPNYGKSW